MIYGWNWRQLNWYLLISSSRLNVAAGLVQMNEKRRPRSYPPLTKPIHNNSLRISNKWKHQHHPQHQPSVCLSVCLQQHQRHPNDMESFDQAKLCVQTYIVFLVTGWLWKELFVSSSLFFFWNQCFELWCDLILIKFFHRNPVRQTDRQTQCQGFQSSTAATISPVPSIIQFQMYAAPNHKYRIQLLGTPYSSRHCLSVCQSTSHHIRWKVKRWIKFRNIFTDLLNKKIPAKSTRSRSWLF